MMVKLFLFGCINLLPSFLIAQDCGKAWMHYDDRIALRELTAQQFGIVIPIEKIQIDFLGAPIGIPFNYAIKIYSPYADNVRLKKEGNLLLHREAYHYLLEMRAAAEKVGVKLALNNTYRSYRQQQNLYHKLGEHQAEKPGYSEHHLYTAVDLKAVGDKKLLWLLLNAFEFGWIPSYYFRIGSKIRREPWHWRYVGKLAARKFWCAWEIEIGQEIRKLKI